MKFFKSKSGMTIIELLVAAGIMCIMSIFIGTFLIESFANNLRVEAMADLGNLSQQAVNRIKSEIGQNKRFFDRTERNLTYWRSIRLPLGIAPVAGTKLPQIIDSGSLAPSHEEDFKKPFVQTAFGNALFFAEYQQGLEATSIKRIIDLYRFVAFFLVERSDDRFNRNIPFYLDLVRCASGPYADLHQVREIESPELRAQALVLLREAGVTALWESEQSAEVAFTKLDYYEPGTAPLIEHQLKLDDCQSVVIGIGKRERNAGPLTYTVAFNKSEQFPVNRPVPLFAKAAADVPRFPSGFEVAVIGPKSGRQVLLRLVLASEVRRQILARDSTVIATIRD